MPIPTHIFDPPFNIVRASHVVLGITDVGRARAFYEGALGLHVEDATAETRRKAKSFFPAMDADEHGRESGSR